MKPRRAHVTARDARQGKHQLHLFSHADVTAAQSCYSLIKRQLADGIRITGEEREPRGLNLGRLTLTFNSSKCKKITTGQTTGEVNFHVGVLGEGGV